MWHLIRRIVIMTLVVWLPFSSMAAQGEPALARKDVQQFLKSMQQKYAFSEQELNAWFKDTKINPEILEKISKPAEYLPWYQYKTRFLNPDRVEEGLKFWEKHRRSLAQAEATYGVPQEVILAILGVETRYGLRQGTYPVLDALSTLAFAYPPRSAFFKSELEHFLLLTKEQGLDPTQVKGSYAGAMGASQFISSSYRRFAVDAKSKGHIDLMNNPEDAIASVANYFYVHGWKAGQPVIVAAKLSPNAAVEKFEISPKAPKPIYRLPQLVQHGVQPKNSAPELKDSEFALVSFDEENGKSFWLGLNNFYVITCYNHSHHYAMAVYELSEMLKQARVTEQKKQRVG
jgi:membrane-bound lytic murein transglycosylase B